MAAITTPAPAAPGADDPPDQTELGAAPPVAAGGAFPALLPGPRPDAAKIPLHVARPVRRDA